MNSIYNSKDQKLCLMGALLILISVVAFADDAWTWTRQYDGSRNLNAVAAGNGTFVAVGDSGAVLTSPDGVEWTERNAGIKHKLYSVIWGDGIFVAVGDSGTIITSANVAEWTVRHSGKGYGIVSIVEGNGKYIAMSGISDSDYDHYALLSDDGIGWQTEYKFDEWGAWWRRTNLVYGDGLWMAGVYDYSISISTDRIIWYGEYPEIGYQGRINFTSLWCDKCDNGPPYPPQFPCMPASADVNSIAYGNGVFLLLAKVEGAGTMARYEKGNTWEILDMMCTWFGKKDVNIGHGIFYDGTRFIMFGDGIYSTDNGDSFELMSATSLKDGASMTYNGTVYVTVNGTEIGTLSTTASISNHRQNIQRKTAPLVTVRGRTLNVNAGAGSEVRIRVITLTGRTAASFKSSGGAKLSLKRIPSGIYVIEAKNAIDGRWVTSPVLLR